MRWIDKKSEPRELTAHRATSNATFDNIPAQTKNVLKQALLDEQGALCAYCMRRIRFESMKVEHREPRGSAQGQARTLDWSNLLGVCLGHQGAPPRRQTCDTRKGQTPIRIDPVQRGHVARLSYPAGRLESSDAAHQLDIDETLNLNQAALVNGREAARSGLFEAWKEKKGQWDKAFMARKLGSLRTGQELREFLGIIEWALELRMRKTK